MSSTIRPMIGIILLTDELKLFTSPINCCMCTYSAALTPTVYKFALRYTWENNDHDMFEAVSGAYWVCLQKGLNVCYFSEFGHYRICIVSYCQNENLARYYILCFNHCRNQPNALICFVLESKPNLGRPLLVVECY